MYVRRYEVELMQFDAYRVHKQLLVFVPPVLLVLGTVGNVLSLIILTRRTMRKYSTYMYLAVLAVADTVVLYAGLLRLWVGELVGSDLRDTHDWVCKAISMIGYTFSDYSGWLVVIVTVERYVAVCHPLRTSTLCYRAKAVRTLACVLLALVAANAHFFWTVSVGSLTHQNETVWQCAGADGYRLFIDDVWPWLDACVYSFVPFLVIIALNVLIIRRVVQSRRMRHELQPTFAQRIGTETRARQRHAEDNRMSVMLVTVSCVFLLLTLPLTLSNIAAKFLLGRDTSLEHMIAFRLARTVTLLLMYSNHSVNFFFYCALGRKFRAHLYRLTCTERRVRKHALDSKMWPLIRFNGTMRNTGELTVRAYVKRSATGHKASIPLHSF